MDNFNRPTKEQIRAWLLERRQVRSALPDLEQIRLQVGWKLGGANRESTFGRLASLAELAEPEFGSAFVGRHSSSSYSI